MLGLSSGVWVAVDWKAAPAALFGIAPLSGEPTTGRFWMVLLDAFNDTEEDLRAVTRLVLDEMLARFDQVENVVDSRKVWTLDLLRSLGFTVEPAVPRTGSEARYHRVWREAAHTNAPRLN